MKDNFLYLGRANTSHRYHMGHTLDGRLCEDRWRKDAAYSKLPYFPTKIGEYPIGDMLDWNIRPHVLEDPYITSPKDEGEDLRSPEIYDVDKCVENPDEYYNNVILRSIEAAGKKYAYNVKTRYTPRTLQTEAAEKVASLWKGETIIIPLAIDPRLGKDYTQLDIFYRSGLRIMISPGGWLSANSSIVETIEKRSQITADIETIPPDPDRLLDILDKGARAHIDWSLHGDNDHIDPRFFEILKEWDAYIACDEADHAIWTDNKRPKLYEFINSGNSLVTIATGTNIERALVGLKGKIHAPIQQSYLDALELKRKGDPTYKDFVEIGCLNLDANQAFIDEQNALSDEDRPNLTKLFNSRNSHVQRTWVKQNIFDEDYGDDLFAVTSRTAALLGYKMPVHPAGMVWINGKKKDLDNLSNVIRSYCNSIGVNINVIVLHGDIRVNGEKMTNKIAERVVKKSIENTKCEKTVILSCGMGSRSFSVPNVVWSMDCIDGGSPGPAKQRALRMATPGDDNCPDKEFGLHFNYTFNPNRSSTFENDLIGRGMNDKSDTDGSIRRVHGLVNFLKDKDTFRSEVDFREYITSSENITNIASAVTFPVDEMLNDDILVEIWNKLKKSSKPTPWGEVLKKATSFIKEKKKKGFKVPTDDDKKAIMDLRAKIATITKTAGNASYLAPDTLSFRECLEVIAHDDDKDNVYHNLVGVSAGIVLEYFLPYANTTFVDLIISRNSKCKTYERFDYEHSSHPEGLFDEFLAGINNAKILYLAKEPGPGVLSDLEKCSSKGEVWVLACQPGYIDFYRKLEYNVLSLADLYLDLNMEFDVAIGNSPFQSENKTGKKGKGGNNSLYLQFIDICVKQVKSNGGIVSLITPPAGLVKSTEFGKPTKTLTQMLQVGSLNKLDLTTNKHFEDVGTPISSWTFVKGAKQGKVNVIGDYGSYESDVKDIYHLPPTFDKIELELYKKIVSNKEGERLVVVRGKKNQPCTMARFGYPKVQYGGDQELGFDKKFYSFFASRLGLWLLDYIRRHDQMIYHNALTGIMIPDDGFVLTEEEDQFLKSRKWTNYSRKELDAKE